MLDSGRFHACHRHSKTPRGQKAGFPVVDLFRSSRIVPEGNAIKMGGGPRDSGIRSTEGAIIYRVGCVHYIGHWHVHAVVVWAAHTYRSSCTISQMPIGDTKAVTVVTENRQYWTWFSSNRDLCRVPLNVLPGNSLRRESGNNFVIRKGVARSRAASVVRPKLRILATALVGPSVTTKRIPINLSQSG
jgi:hypothetical protein